MFSPHPNAASVFIIFVAACIVLWNYSIYDRRATAEHDIDINCSNSHGYEIEFISQEPLLIHIQNFLSQEEASYFTSIVDKNFTHRLYVDEEDVKKAVAPRLAVLNQHESVVKCVLSRAQKFLGSMSSPDFELLSVARYGVPHQVSLHSDASPEPLMDKKSKRLYNRRTSFFVYVHASEDLEGGETFFPRIPPRQSVGLPVNPAIVTVNNSSGKPGVAVKPISRSAVFWLSVNAEGRLDYNTIHEGLPVRKGEKVGMNIWAKHYID